MNQQRIIGWDVGGAHLKAVLINAQGHVLNAKQVYCPLWRGLDELGSAIDAILPEMQAESHVVTMTGELADIFPDRHSGVLAIAQTMQRKLSAVNCEVQLRFFAGKQGFVVLEQVAQVTSDIASMNWLASMQYLAQKLPQAIFIDIGSTTTDIALLSDGKPNVLGLTDATRMQFDELVYTGVVRTPLMALAQKIPFAGQLVNVAAEHFATTADVYTLTGELSADENMADTADGTDRSVASSARRIARMVGWDAHDAPLATWIALAHAFKHAQLNLVRQAVLTKLSSKQNTAPTLQLIGAGAGEFLTASLAQQLDVPYRSASDFISAESGLIKNMAKVCFPAFAVASLGLSR
ncbi:H4MPT-linked C1 transfer pathway protein [Methylotenera oryzisoli]|uniref:H4MPT-linked C1 transfer pathway protein n=1 Tax=Methylotenera oryzisoli TaxID=2080758 RepID=A0A4Y9VVK5_9PROT|nr:hydantoinase/oxoprolinase family protein [Methylotenera oryzisoli]TFW73129.1 H4MPT-linked C1 transfer pathway protein [Methylotenera oryzisoli]